MLKNKQPINLGFLVCLSIQSSDELTLGSRKHPNCFTAQRTPPLHCMHAICPWKSSGLWGPWRFQPRMDRPNPGCRELETAHPCLAISSITVWLQAQMRTVRQCDWVRRQSHLSAAFWAKLTATGLGKEGSVSIASQSWLLWWQEGLLHGWALGVTLQKYSWAFCWSKNYQVRSLNFQGGKERKGSSCFTVRSFHWELLFKNNQV